MWGSLYSPQLKQHLHICRQCTYFLWSLQHQCLGAALGPATLVDTGKLFWAQSCLGATPGSTMSACKRLSGPRCSWIGKCENVLRMTWLLLPEKPNVCHLYYEVYKTIHSKILSGTKMKKKGLKE